MALRFDVSYDGSGANLDYHFCREFNGNGDGCFGTDPTHGLSFKQACDEIVMFHLEQAKYWSTLTYKKWSHPTTHSIPYLEEQVDARHVYLG